VNVSIMGSPRNGRSTNFGRVESTQNMDSHAATELVESPSRQLDDADLGVTQLLRSTVSRPRWEVRYAQGVAVSDLTAMAASLGLHKWWGNAPGYDHARIVFGLSLMVLTVLALGIARAWDSAVLGQGSQEFNRLLRALITLAVVVGLLGLALKQPEVRPYVFGVIPVSCVLAAGSRLVLRKVLHRRRRSGTCMHEVLAVGTEDAVTKLILRTRRAPHNGWAVTGACTPSGASTDGGPSIMGVPVVGDLNSASEVAGSGAYRVVSVAQTPGWSSQRLHHMAWDLEGTGTELVVDPGLMEIAGPRLHVSAVDGLPLLRLTEPAFSGAPRVVKGMIDLLGASVLLIVLAPVMIALAIAVRTDGGPVFYRQCRVGKGGKPFMMIKFRSMVMGADQHQSELVEGNQGRGPLFKLHQDPRVTRVGLFLRKYSLDELPQLFNVLSGGMSLVGPRPPLPAEVASYSRDAQRKLLVKPGLTGLWQISGRSDLSWEESVRLDLRYVENWSLALDILIIWKTLGAVVRGAGAY
jgi:exopolysaccharide biosynthesis polyprenyl glycosylphosphotransferase